MTLPTWLRGVLQRLSLASAKAAVRLHPRLALRSELPPFTFVEDGLGTCHNSDFACQPRFQHAYDLGRATGSWRGHELRWRIHVLLWCATVAARLPASGSFVECGVNRGGFARAIIDYLDQERIGRDFFLFDTFAGFDRSQLSATEAISADQHYAYEDCFADVQRTFADMPFVKLVRGSVPGSLIDVGPVVFLSIDMNCALPEIAAARFFWPHLVPGAPVVLDDYGFALHHEQKQCFDVLAKEWNVEILSLPTGQGIIFKP